MSERANQRKVRVGRVISDGMDKTVVVAIERRVRHPLYHKSVRRLHKFKAHDETNEYRVGDTVTLIETRPLSKTKRWRIAGLLHRQDLPEVAPAVAAELPPEPAVDSAPIVAASAEVEEEPAAEEDKKP